MKYLKQLKEYWLSRPDRVRSIVYLIPSFVFFLPGLLIDSGRAQKAALRSFCLGLLFLGVVFLIYLFHFYIWTQSVELRYFRQLVFFFLQLAAILAYVGLSGKLILAESKDNPTPDFWLDRVSNKVVRFLEFKA
ncbi:MAG: hypothetical protein RH862_01150 [Leptospiraceae bacterium]